MLTVLSFVEALPLLARRGIPIPIPQEYQWIVLAILGIIIVVRWLISKAAQRARAESFRKNSQALQERLRQKVREDLNQTIRRVMILMVAADGQIEDAEIKSVQKAYQEVTDADLTREAIEDELDGLKESGVDMQALFDVVGSSLNAGEKVLLPKAALTVAACDGVLQDAEKERLIELAGALHIPPEVFSTIVQGFLRAAWSGSAKREPSPDKNSTEVRWVPNNSTEEEGFKQMASSAEFVGEFWLGEGAEIVI